MTFEFDNLRIDGDLQSRWDVLLRIVGDFRLSVRGVVLYREAEFCLVEFAVALGNWVAIPATDRQDLVYTSLESDTVGLVRFTQTDGGSWQVSAAHQERSSSPQVPAEDIERAVLAYIHDLRDRLSSTLDILDYFEDAGVRGVLRRKLG